MSQKIGILTFHASHNYGSMLQAYALQTYLENLGCEVSILNYRGAPQKMLYPKPYKYWDINALKGRLMHPFLFYKNCIKWNKFEHFMQQHMKLTDLHSTIGETKQILMSQKFDAIIVGGDQIWAVSNTDFYLGYFLPFSLPKCKKIAYAPSMGDFKWTHPNDIDIFLRSSLADFDALSIREKSAIETLQQIVQKEIVAMPDPAWLLSPEEYNKLDTKERIIGHKYLFYYDPKNEQDKGRYITNYAKRIGLKAVNSNSQYCPMTSFINKNVSGPIEFLNLIRNADIVVGRSLHLLVFALLYHKPFLIITSNPDTRLIDMLSSFHILDRIVSPEQLCSLPQPQDIDWNLVDDRINKMRSKANMFFKTHILCNQ